MNNIFDDNTQLNNLENKDINNNETDSINSSSTINETNNTALIVSEPNVAEFREIVHDIATNPNVLALKDRIQHNSHSRYYHCLCVSYYSYAICKKLNLDYVAAARAGMLHDFYYYDWRVRKLEDVKRFHAFRHPKIALKNAKDLFEINEKEADIIKNHMWPLTFYRLPKYKETYIITLVDKYCASKEKIKSLKKKFKLKF